MNSCMCLKAIDQKMEQNKMIKICESCENLDPGGIHVLVSISSIKKIEGMNCICVNRIESENEKQLISEFQIRRSQRQNKPIINV